MRQLKSNLLKSWDYFYNSGGWDDYPPQVYVHKNALAKYVAPVINTAQCIRIAKIMVMAAETLGLQEDIREYQEDIDIFSQAIQKYAWDGEEGYFSYVSHDDDGNPTGFLRHESGTNFNMGLDGAYPLVAGICTDEQKEILLDHLIDERRLWTPIGLSTVDRSAPYYRVEGYWNGAVWMPHQWFYWKTMLDLDRRELAYRIAKTGLELWKSEVDTSYNCFEHFIVQSGRGAGWHQFGGLSAPVLSWFNAYHSPGRITCGFDVWVEKKQFDSNNTQLKARLKLFGQENQALCILVSMNPDHQYRVLLDGNQADYKAVLPGVLEISIPRALKEVELNIMKLD
jgi:hypothetical protein